MESAIENPRESNVVPRGFLDCRGGNELVVLTAYRVELDEAVTVEMMLDQWYELPPVQYVVKLELSRKQPRRPVKDPDAELPVPRGHIEWKNGQNWVVLTAYRAGTREAATVEVTLGQWFRLIPVRAVVDERLERWESNRLLQMGQYDNPFIRLVRLPRREW